MLAAMREADNSSFYREVRERVPHHHPLDRLQASRCGMPQQLEQRRRRRPRRDGGPSGCADGSSPLSAGRWAVPYSSPPHRVARGRYVDRHTPEQITARSMQAPRPRRRCRCRERGCHHWRQQQQAARRQSASQQEITEEGAAGGQAAAAGSTNLAGILPGFYCGPNILAMSYVTKLHHIVT